MSTLKGVVAASYRLKREDCVTEIKARAFYVHDAGTTYTVVLSNDLSDATCNCPATHQCEHVGAALLTVRSES